MYFVLRVVVALLINCASSLHRIAYHNRDVDGSWSHRELLVRWYFWRSCHQDGILTFGYMLPRQVPVHNPYFRHFILCLCIKFQGVEWNPLAYIYLYPMSLTSMIGSCRLLCYRTPDRNRVIACHSREIGNILLLLLYQCHLEYIYEW